ncbi:hypothetical protein Q6348_08010 [Isoptericola sp. b441]|uniref:HNH endonuclease n=1 Tax=Actinotalea lenta TaxID=3064654 RepID=A0ABT9DA44_9CELL|nr:hypothetical protein [Isoptericola sp. b441]MDO8107139.1 hypothetical protein [Isoptericola sp. b441]
MKLPVHQMSTPALAQRRAELMRARYRIDVELRRVTGVLLERDRANRPKPITHGAAGYRRGCRCPVCTAGKTNEKRRERAARSADTNPGRER